MSGGRTSIAVLLLVAAAPACTSIITTQIYVRQTNRALQDYYGENLAEDWTPSDSKRHRELREGEVADFEIPVGAGEVVGILGACDKDCTALTMQILDEDGFPVASVTESTRHPWVTIDPGDPATYTVRIGMAECSSEPCFASYWTMRGPSPEIESLYHYYIETLESDWAGIGPIYRGDLDRLRSRNFAWSFLGGEEASVIAACDPNCSNLNVQVIDPDGFPLTNLASGGSDQRLTVSFAVESTGDYRVDIGMGECQTDPCSFAYWVLERRSSSDADEQ